MADNRQGDGRRRNRRVIFVVSRHDLRKERLQQQMFVVPHKASTNSLETIEAKSEIVEPAKSVDTGHLVPQQELEFSDDVYKNEVPVQPNFEANSPEVLDNLLR